MVFRNNVTEIGIGWLLRISIMLYFQSSKITFTSVSESRLRFPISKKVISFCWNKSLGFKCIYYGFVREEIKRKRADDHVHVQISSVADIIWADEDTRHSEPLKWYGTLTVQSWPKIFDRLKPNRNPMTQFWTFHFLRILMVAFQWRSPNIKKTNNQRGRIQQTICRTRGVA